MIERARQNRKRQRGAAGWRRPVICALFLLCFRTGVGAQEIPDASTNLTEQEQAKPELGPDDTLVTMFRHAEWDRFWLSGQANFISQYHPTFHSPYQGTNSLTPEAQDATSRLLTLYTGWRINSNTEFLCDVQEAGGHGLSEALGMAGAFNLDVVRNPTLSKAPYIARLMWHQIIPLSTLKEVNERSPYSLFRELPERRLEIRFGKFSMADFFDQNTYGSDTNFQFMNWTTDNDGAFDYAADTRGFTFAVMVEYHQKSWSLRFAEGLMPKVANGIHLEADLSLARAENVELELRRKVVGKHEGTLRILSFVNHANMGIYKVAVDNYLQGITPTPEIAYHPLQTTVKYGFGLNFEQPINEWMGVFGRWGWNEGKHESFAYTEDDETFQIGAGANGSKWGRRYDRLGLAFVSNGISHEHQQYLGYGGLGFVLGDGRLNYGRENILETFYTVHVWRGFYPAVGLQYAWDPGYNRVRGPVIVPTLRLHLEF
jgi:high affinity Mn2+ porin